MSNTKNTTKRSKQWTIHSIKHVIDIHDDGDIYVYDPKTDKMHYIGLIIDDETKIATDIDGIVISGPIFNPVAKKLHTALNNALKSYER